MIAAELMQTNFISVDVNDTISSLVGLFRKEKLFDAVILDDGHFAGLVKKRAFLRISQDITAMKVKNLLVKVPKLKPSMPIEEIPVLMDAADAHILPVVEGDKVHGVVCALALLNQLKAAFEGVKIFELLKHALITIEENTPMSKVINCLYQKRIDHLPVVDAHNKLVGIVSITDLITKYCVFPPKKEQQYSGRMHESHPWKQFNATHLPVKNEATPLVYSIRKEDSLVKALAVMVEKSISSVIITESDNPIGIITIKDMLNFYIQHSS